MTTDSTAFVTTATKATDSHASTLMNVLEDSTTAVPTPVARTTSAASHVSARKATKATESSAKT